MRPKEYIFVNHDVQGVEDVNRACYVQGVQYVHGRCSGCSRCSGRSMVSRIVQSNRVAPARVFIQSHSNKT